MKILFDETQKERGLIFDNFQKLAETLENSGHQLSRLDTFPIKYSEITRSDIVVFLCPDGSKLYGHEVKALLRFVDEGGSVAVFANAGGDRGLNTNMNTLLKHFDMEIVANQLFDYKNYDLKLESNPIITQFYNHSITEGLNEVTLVSSCSINIGKKVVELARTSSDSDPPSATVMAIASYGLGTVFVCGSYLMLSDLKSGLKLKDNKKLAENIFNFISESQTEKTEQKTPEKELKIEQETEPLKERYEDKHPVEEIPPQAISPMSIVQELKEEMKIKEPVEAKAEEKLSKDDIYSAMAIIQDLEKDISELNIEDPGYRDILLTDMARRKGIDYSQVLPYLEKIREKERRKTESGHTKEVGTRRMDEATIPTPSPADRFEEEVLIFDETLEEQIHASSRTTPTTQQLQRSDLTEVVDAIKELKNSVDVLSANLIHLMSEIVLEIKEQKGKKRIF
ncbi:MAG: hypothetical protein KGD64_09525 [Candidatus Heimdallarchaeota archaeon]|nr:hypothetical protein [Candidatus Heimdallarchaeota archaeon]